MALAAFGAVMTPFLIVVRSIFYPGWSAFDAMITPVAIGAILLVLSPAIFLWTLPAAIWGVIVLRHRFSSRPVADLALGVLVALVSAALFLSPHWLVGAPTSRDWWGAASVFAACAAYFSVAFHTFRRLGGIQHRAVVEGRPSNVRLATTAATETILGVIALAWTGAIITVLELLAMIGPSD